SPVEAALEPDAAPEPEASTPAEAAPPLAAAPTAPETVAAPTQPQAAAAPEPVPVPAQPAPRPARGRPTLLTTFTRLVTFLFGVLQALLILRIVLLLLVANEENDIVSTILSITAPFVDPFRDMFQLDTVTGDQGSVLDIAAIVALIGWTLLEGLIVSLLRVFDRRSA
ncbi:MAG: YggT family protein, partial [Chloroflexota bacterium]|nr:YggT family protein [Chloroflexota bacterium]